jgi:hypothetical protein
MGDMVMQSDSSSIMLEIVDKWILNTQKGKFFGIKDLINTIFATDAHRVTAKLKHLEQAFSGHDVHAAR